MSNEQTGEHTAIEGSNQKVLPKKHPDISGLSLAKQTRLFEREAIVKQFIEYRRKFGRIPSKDRERAAKLLGVTPRMVHQLIKVYLAYRDAYPDEPPVNVFVPLPPGPEEGFRAKLTEKQKRLLRYAILKRVRPTIGAGGRRGGGKQEYDFEVLDVYRFAFAIDNTIGSYSTVQRYVSNFQRDYPAIFKLFTERATFERDYIPKIANDVQRPNQRWQSDIRDLPFYVIYEGLPCPVSLIIICDDYSRRVIAWKLHVKVKRDLNGHVRRVNPTAVDVAELLAKAMYTYGLRPEEWYTDNGSQYIALDALIAVLSDEPPIAILHTRPREPWGRGKVENGLGQVTLLLKRLQDGYRRRKSRDSIEEARRSARYTIEELEAEFERHFKSVNTISLKGKPSRQQLWTSKPSLPQPELWRLAHLVSENKKFERPITDDGANFLGIIWEPRIAYSADRNKQIYKRWTEAATSPHDHVIWAVCLGGIWRAELSVRGTWIELVPKGSQQPSGESRGKGRGGTMRDINAEGLLLLAEAEAEVLAQASGIPYMDTATGNYILPNDMPPEERPATHSHLPKRRTRGGGRTATNVDGAARQTKATSKTSEQAPPTPRRFTGMEEVIRKLLEEEDAI